MASIQYLIFASAIILLMFVHEGHGIKCYDCNSHSDNGCADSKPPPQYEKECNEYKNGPKYTLCRKITQIIEFSVNNLPPDTRTIRSCGYEVGNYENKCYQRSGFGGRQEVCACDGELCNGAVKTKAAFGVLLAVLVAFIARA